MTCSVSTWRRWKTRQEEMYSIRCAVYNTNAKENVWKTSINESDREDFKFYNRFSSTKQVRRYDSGAKDLFCPSLRC